MTYRELADRLRRRFREAEGIVLKNRPPEKKVRWFKTRCPKCNSKIEYSPKSDWNGLLRCGECGHEFRLSLLDHFTIEYEDEVS